MWIFRMSERIIVIGAGHGGAQLVDSLRAGGYCGDLIMIGDEAHRPYDRPSTSKGLLSGSVDLERTFLKRERYYADHRVELRLGTRVTELNRHARTVGLSTGETLVYDRLVMATGARARRLSVPGSELDGVYCLRSLADSQAIAARLGPGKRVAIIGGGYVGLEVAASATGLGCSVTLIEMQERLLARVAGEEISRFYSNLHRRAGVELLLGTALEGFTGEAAVRSVLLADGREIAVDVVVVGVGAVPNTELACAAGLTVENGIVVDDCGRTSDPGIFAIGDATNHPNSLIGKRIRLESVPAALGQARAAASAILGDPKPFHELPWFWSDQYDVKLQIAGLSQPEDEVVIRGDPATGHFAAFYLREGRIVAVNSVNSAKDFVLGKKLIAEHRVPDAGRLADPAVPLAQV
jgi:3-phenylpropionate/trans-cinnamate dioxygenase ferredoxin reductase component